MSHRLTPTIFKFEMSASASISAFKRLASPLPHLLIVESSEKASLLHQIQIASNLAFSLKVFILSAERQRSDDANS